MLSFLVFVYLFFHIKEFPLWQRAWVGTGSWSGVGKSFEGVGCAILIIVHFVLHILAMATVLHLFRILGIT